MSVATIERQHHEPAVNAARDIDDVTAYLAHTARLRRSFTAEYQPRHRAEGLAI